VSDNPPEPWNSFLREIDGFVSEETTFILLGGFVVTVLYGAPRTTSDVDALTVTGLGPRLLRYAGEGSPLHRKHDIYLDPVGVATLPENYEERLTEIYANAYKKLRLFALDAYDIALAKIERNIARDRDDVKHLARVVPFDLDVLRGRYYDELRICLGNPEREDLTLALWIEMIEEQRA
jgi:hypothetical protein